MFHSDYGRDFVSERLHFEVVCNSGLLELVLLCGMIERSTKDLLKPYIHRYEIVWRLLVVPLRSSGSIYLRDGIDELFEEFAMCHYTTYVNVARVFEKIDSCADDFKFAEETCANMHRAAEVAIKAVAAFRAAGAPLTLGLRSACGEIKPSPVCWLAKLVPTNRKLALTPPE